MILHIHGFRTTADSQKAKLFASHFGDDLITPNYSFPPNAAISDMEKVIEQENITGMIASSLGGYYASYLSSKYNLKTVLINPSVEPHITTREYLGAVQKNDGTIVEWRAEYLDDLHKLWVDELVPENYYLFLKTADEVLDYRVAKRRYLGAQMLIDDGGDHRFTDIMNHIDKIESFLL